MSTVINFGKTISLEQAASLILAVPDNIIFLRGEPGIGKSSILDFLADKLPNHIVADPIDVPNLDLGDAAMPVVDKERMLTNYAPNSRFKMTLGKPVIMMLDEYPKGADPVKNMLHPLFEAKRRRLGDVYLEPGSIVFLTGNLASDNVGDSLKGHTLGRITVVEVRKPDAELWLNWAATSDAAIDPLVMAFVSQFPHCLASYRDGEANNMYGYNPKQMTLSYVSPRSLERASNIIKARKYMDSETLVCGLMGTIGEAAARDMQAFIEYRDQLPTWDSIIKSPSTVAVPESPGACAVMVFMALEKIDKTTIPAWMEYLDRFESEWQASFIINLARHPVKQRIAFSCQAFADWCGENEDLL
tara:strand:+ start:336 stop:1412 length:1077 start_codon:yes stop_codon:yes gene_type:complete